MFALLDHGQRKRENERDEGRKDGFILKTQTATYCVLPAPDSKHTQLKATHLIPECDDSLK